MLTTHDLAIIGSGAGAFAAAIRATALGKSVVMVERDTFAGTCLNTGCVPSKALIAAADARHVAGEASSRFPGIVTVADEVDMPALIGGKQDLVEVMRREKYVEVAASHGWQVRHGDAAFAGTPDEPRIEVAGADGTVETIAADHYLIATGSRPWAPPIEGLDKVGYLTSTTAMELTEIPATMLVIGGGYVALEQAQLFGRLGSKVTMLARSRLASKEEPEVSQTLEEVFADEGIRVVSHALPTNLTRDETTGEVVVTADVAGEPQEFRADKLLVALGRRPATDALNLHTVGVQTGPSGEIVVTGQLRTSNPRVWAAGDVTGHPGFVYVAARHGTLVAENAFTSTARDVDYTHLPRVTFTSPAIGAVGMTEQAALAAGIRCVCRVLPLHHVARARVNRDTKGFIKMVANADTGAVLGLTAVTKNAGELAAAGVHILNKTIGEVADAWAPYLTMAEGVRIVAKTFTTDASKLSCCA